MSNPMLTCKLYEINGQEFKIRPLSVAAARPIISILQKCTGAMHVGGGKMDNLVLTSMIGGAINDQDIDTMIKAFGPTTTVEVPSESGKEPRQLLLDKASHQDELFAGQIEFMYEWLQACLDYNFKGTIAKLYAAAAAVAEFAKTAPEFQNT